MSMAEGKAGCWSLDEAHYSEKAEVPAVDSQ
jgi:hypothetical protein